MRLAIGPVDMLARAKTKLFVRSLGAIAAAGFLASCSAGIPSVDHVKFSSAKYGVPASPRLVRHGRPVPKGGGHYMVGKPYRVAGRTYVPRDNPNYSKVGLASWYGPNFHGRMTANGEIYDLNGLTAAHPTLPLPSYVRVTNLHNGRSIVVRVNDRGPYAANRIIDVSETVAEILGFKRAGTARVKVDYVGPARMDGRDTQMLLASYRAPGVPGGTMFAANTPPQPEPSRARPVLASFDVASAPPPEPATRPRLAFNQVSRPAMSAPMDLNPGYSPDAMTDDPIGPLIMRNGLARSYASAPQLTPAHAAAEAMAEGGSTEVLARAAAAKARLIGASAVTIQLGTFGDATNAATAAERFGSYGKVETHTIVRGTQTLHVVQVALADGTTDPQRVIAAAKAVGLNDAYVIGQ